MLASSICLHSVLVRLPAVGMLAPAWPQSGAHGPGQVAPACLAACQPWSVHWSTSVINQNL